MWICVTAAPLSVNHTIKSKKYSKSKKIYKVGAN